MDVVGLLPITLRLRPHDLDVPVTGTGGEFETLLIEDRDRAASVANQLPAL
jgi:hypothetical protein